MSIQELSEPSEDETAASAEVERDAATYLDIPRIEYSPDQRSFDSSDEVGYVWRYAVSDFA